MVNGGGFADLHEQPDVAEVEEEGERRVCVDGRESRQRRVRQLLLIFWVGGGLGRKAWGVEWSVAQGLGIRV